MTVSRLRAVTLLVLLLVAAGCGASPVPPTASPGDSGSPILPPPPAATDTPPVSDTPPPVETPAPPTVVVDPSIAPSPDPSVTTDPPTPSQPPSEPVPGEPTPSPSAGAASSLPSATCIRGWTRPDVGSAIYEEGLDLIRGQQGVTGDFVIDEMRYFLGPDVPWIIDPHFDVVRRWYVKGSVAADPPFRGRWILEYRDDERRGIAAVAPYDTPGYISPDWHAFEGDGPFREVSGLPGLWAGIDYDFVNGEGGNGQPGLPVELLGCLEGT